jgi:hypothetical protein
MIEASDVKLLLLAVAGVAIVTVFLHDRHYVSRRDRILENRVRMLEEIVGEWTAG